MLTYNDRKQIIDDIIGVLEEKGTVLPCVRDSTKIGYSCTQFYISVLQVSKNLPRVQIIQQKKGSDNLNMVYIGTSEGLLYTYHQKIEDEDSQTNAIQDFENISGVIKKHPNLTVTDYNRFDELLKIINDTLK